MLKSPHRPARSFVGSGLIATAILAALVSGAMAAAISCTAQDIGLVVGLLGAFACALGLTAYWALAFEHERAQREITAVRVASDAAVAHYRNLIAVAAPEIDAQYRASCEEFGRLNAFLLEANERLVTAFTRVHQLSALQKEMTERITAGDGEGTGGVGMGTIAAARTSAALTDIIRDIETQIGAAVTTLQYQDLANQMIDHLCVRAAQALCIVQGMDSAAAHPPPDLALCVPDESPLTALIEAAREATRHNPASASRMTSGTIEFF